MTALPKPDAVLLDLDDTLVAWSATLPAAVDSLASRLAQTVPGVDAQVLAAVLHRCGRTAPGLGLRETVERACARLGVTAPPDVDGPLGPFAADRLAALQPLRGAAEAVWQLRPRVRRLGVVTNGDAATQRAKLAGLGVTRAFDLILTAEEAGCDKSDQAIYRRALAALGVDPARAWMVGDSLDQDVAVPQRLGMAGVWVVWPAAKFSELPLPEDDLPQHSEVVPDLIVKRLPDLLQWL